jgi:hypothetical protein
MANIANLEAIWRFGSRSKNRSSGAQRYEPVINARYLAVQFGMACR